jgi:histidine ammonia-lyase
MIEDRMTMAGLGARRLAELTDLGFRAAAISCVIACQAIDLRGLVMRPLGRTIRVVSWVSVGLAATYVVNAALVYLGGV